jgi:two-component system sensor histidine kinase KdpD
MFAAATTRLKGPLSEHLLIKDIAPDLPFVDADPLLLEQALVNVLDNAAKYSPAGSPIGLRARMETNLIVVTVEDEGSGIPPAELAHVFDKFHRMRKADRKVAGTGLGLSVARGFVEAFGGTLSAANRLDRNGAIFTFRLPVEPEAKG